MTLKKELINKFELDLKNYINECNFEDKSLTPFILRINCPTINDLNLLLSSFSNGINIGDNFVPHTTYWLIDNDKIIGVSNLRHKLNDELKNIGGHIGYSIRPSERGKGYATKLLSLTIAEGKKLGITEFLLTCDKDNITSARTIQKNNGVLISEDNVDGTLIQRYLIK
jgi:predicted acetyltransferase